MSKLKVVISALIYPMTMMHFFWRAFERREDVELFVLGPFSDNRIPWNNGMTLHRKYVKMPNFAMPQSPFMPPYEVVQAVVPRDIDLWLQIDAGFHFITKPKAKVVAHIQTDPHVLKDFYKTPIAYSDYNFCMQEIYREEGEILLPYAYDPEIHFHEDRQKIYDACLIGLHYQHRDDLIHRLRERGLNVYYSIGEVYDQYREKYNQSKIALSWSSKQDLPSRFFEGLAMQLPVVSNVVPDQKVLGFYSEEHFLGFTNLDGAENQVMRLLNDKELLDNIAISGYNKVKEHTWDMRVQQILEECKLL
jgi:hypothetical protein